jgi:hypothetical protein
MESSGRGRRNIFHGDTQVLTQHTQTPASMGKNQYKLLLQSYINVKQKKQKKKQKTKKKKKKKKPWQSLSLFDGYYGGDFFHTLDGLRVFLHRIATVVITSYNLF